MAFDEQYLFRFYSVYDGSRKLFETDATLCISVTFVELTYMHEEPYLKFEFFTADIRELAFL